MLARAVLGYQRWAMRSLLLAASSALAACAGIVDDPAFEPVPPGAGAPHDAGAHAEPGRPDAAVHDDAVLLAHTLPGALECGASAAATVTMVNSGSRAWSRAQGDHLTWLTPDAGPPARLEGALEVEPGVAFTFEVAVKAPQRGGPFVTGLQMSDGSGRRYGAQVEHSISVNCPTPGCTFPQGVPDPDYTFEAVTSAQVASVVDAAMESLTGCTRGAACPLGARWPTAQAWFAAVAEAVRRRGLCAGQHIDGVTAEIAVSADGCRGRWYGYDVHDEGGGGRVLWNPAAQRGAWSIRPSRCP